MIRRKAGTRRAPDSAAAAPPPCATAEAVRGLQNAEAVHGLVRTLSAAPRPCHGRREDHEFVVFCFARSDDAQQPFGGERLG